MLFNMISPQIQPLFADFCDSLAFFGFFRFTPKISAAYLSGGNKPNPKSKLIQMALYRHLRGVLSLRAAETKLQPKKNKLLKLSAFMRSFARCDSAVAHA